MVWRITADMLRFEEALDALLARVVITEGEVQSLRDRSRSQAFWIAGATELDVVQSVFDDIERALERGLPFEEFKQRAAAKLADEWGEDRPHRVELIFRNAAQSSYSAGRFQQMREPAVLRARPFWMYDAVRDTKTSDICRALDGTIRLADDPFWDTHTPLLHHACRGGIRSLRDSEARRRGITETLPAVEADPGFGRSPPIAPEWRPDPTNRDPELMTELQGKVTRRTRRVA